ncbi:regulatory protein GemA [Jeongeupia wiesaeckerbachi]|uniref:gp16 family protein n=1 Tax=Jeongeupia wiesaeckerbachi TaxID=3051218 RepID=UPI003D807365
MTQEKYSNRQRLIRLIHVAKRDLSMDDETYRLMLKNETGLSSTSNLSESQLDRVVGALKKKGFKVKPKKPQSRPLAEDAQSRMMRGLWLELHQLGYVGNPSEAALAAYCKRITRVDALQWLNGEQTLAMIESLKKWRDRDALAIAERCGFGGLQYEQLEAVSKLCAKVTGLPDRSKANLAAVKQWLDERKQAHREACA